MLEGVPGREAGGPSRLCHSQRESRKGFVGAEFVAIPTLGIEGILGDSARAEIIH
jgi:hypothetical protein